MKHLSCLPLNPLLKLYFSFFPQTYPFFSLVLCSPNHRQMYSKCLGDSPCSQELETSQRRRITHLFWYTEHFSSSNISCLKTQATRETKKDDLKEKHEEGFEADFPLSETWEPKASTEFVYDKTIRNSLIQVLNL